MEFVGKTVRKDFKGSGVFAGVVKSYDSSSGFFEIRYENGDSEEIDLTELAALFGGDGGVAVGDRDHSQFCSAANPSRAGCKPKKLRRVLGSSNSGNENDFSSSLVDSDGAVGGESGPGDAAVGGLTKTADFSSNNGGNFDHGVENVGLGDEGLDLNSGLGGLHPNVRGNVDRVDLNLDLYAEEHNWGPKGVASVDSSVKKELCFDLNMEVDGGESKNQDTDLGGFAKGGGRERPETEKYGELGASLHCRADPSLVNQPKPLDNVPPVLDYQNSPAKTQVGWRRGRKRKSLSNSINSPMENAIRRSCRKRAKSSDDEHFPDAMDSVMPSPAISAVSEDQPTVSGCEESDEPVVLPPKLELPPSSGTIDLDGFSVLDLFSVYAFLRSFSMLLFLSPFGLGEFVASLRAKSPTLLIDSVHVSLLQALRKHLEFQTDESSPFAAKCLRDLNWDLLDVITWPIFMAQYLLMKPGFDLRKLNGFKTDYYTQPESVKVEILQYLCDDVIEAEAISSELSRRALVDSDRTTKLLGPGPKKRRPAADVSGGTVAEEAVIDEAADWNSDECCLCKMDGNLICCDGCPAAFHSKCVGIATGLLPEGDWFCPECAVDRRDPGSNVGKSTRGAELLGVDPHGRFYYLSCGYLLVSDPLDAVTSSRYYHMSDLTPVVEALNLPNCPYRGISRAVTKHRDLYEKFYGEKSNVNSEISGLRVESLTKGHLLSPQATAAAAEVTPVAAAEAPPPMESSETCANPVKSENPSAEIAKADKPEFEVDRVENVGPSNGCSYVNVYSFARVAASAAGAWARKALLKASQKSTKTLEELMSAQMKSISATPVDFRWSNIPGPNRNERCGWCLACKFPTDDVSCLFVAGDAEGPGGFTSDALGPATPGTGRLVDVACHIVCIEDRLHGLLTGPWVNPHFPKLYRKSLFGGPEISRAKHLLLMLESNIRARARALSPEWLKHVDPAATVGSASHVVISTGRKRSRGSDSEPRSSKNTSGGLSLFWWRGGRLTRKLFSWKVLPRSVASKAARQGGNRKIEGILYPDNSDFAKRTKCLAWRASVESAVSVEQLALQVREFDANIKWDEIENTGYLAKMDKESIKSMRSFKKAIVRRKSHEGDAAKYLLDFGKRRFIPDVVVRHGSKPEESSSGERKRYWVEAAHVPLFLVKSYEERRVAIKSNMKSPGPVDVRPVGPARNAGFSYLFARAERPDKHRCGHCDKDVSIREAVRCQDCEGFFHKKHVKKTSGAASSECTYTCHRCRSGTLVKEGKPQSKKGKKGPKKTKSKTARKAVKGKPPQAKKRAVVVVAPLRRSSRKAKVVSLQKKKTKAKKRKQPPKPVGKTGPPESPDQPRRKRGRPRKYKRDGFRKKRSHVLATYWLNGLLLSRKPDDERAAGFRARSHIGPFGSLTSVDYDDEDRRRCHLCREPEFRPSLNYVSCETCGDWYHGDAFGLQDEHITMIIGFKCHQCRKRAQPTCPHSHASKSEAVAGEAATGSGEFLDRVNM